MKRDGAWLFGSGDHPTLVISGPPRRAVFLHSLDPLRTLKARVLQLD
jgi:hypothetical protein